MQPFEEQLSVINPRSLGASEASPDDSIIHELDLLHHDYHSSPAQFAESFLYAQPLPAPTRKRHPRPSIHEEIKEENRLLERKLTHLHALSRPRAPTPAPTLAPSPSPPLNESGLVKL